GNGAAPGQGAISVGTGPKGRKRSSRMQLLPPGTTATAPVAYSTGVLHQRYASAASRGFWCKTPLKRGTPARSATAFVSHHIVPVGAGVVLPGGGVVRGLQPGVRRPTRPAIP